MNIRKATAADVEKVIAVERVAFGRDSEAELVRALRPGVTGSVRDRVICADTMNRPEHWRK